MNEVIVESPLPVEARETTRRVSLGGARMPSSERRTLPLMASCVLLLLGVDLLFGEAPAATWIEFLLAGATLLLGHEVLGRGGRNLFYELRPDSESLLVLGALIAFCYSFVVSLLHAVDRLGVEHLVVIREGQEFPALYFTTAGLVILGATLGRELQGRWQSRLDQVFRAQWKGLVRGAGGSHSSLDRHREDWSQGTPLMELSERVCLYWSFAVFLLVTFAVAGGFLGHGGIDASVIGFVVTFLLSSSPNTFYLFARAMQILGAFRAGAQGFIPRDNQALETLSRPVVFCFSKLGTLTVGCPQVTDVITTRPSLPAEEVVRLAAILQAQEEHPFREAILLELADSSRTIPQVRGFRSQPGQGMRAVFQGQELVLGTSEYLEEAGMDLSEVREDVARLAEEGKSILILARSEEVLGLIALDDEKREEAGRALEKLRSMGARTVLVSGEDRPTLEGFARDLAFDRVCAGLTVDEMGELFRELREFGDRVVMVGGGVSHAKVLSSADVGLAFGVGQDGLGHSADVVLAGESLEEVPRVFELARQTRRSIVRGFAVLMATQGLCLLAVGGFWLRQILALKAGGDVVAPGLPVGLPYLPLFLGLISALLPAFVVRYALGRLDTIRGLDLEKPAREGL